MKKNKVLYFLTDVYCDWECGYTAAVLNSHTDYMVETVSVDGLAKVSMGGLVTGTDYAVYNCYLDNVALVLIPGGLSWEGNNDPSIYEFIKKCIDKKIMIATIGGSSNYLARNGFLDNVRHTADPLEDLNKYEGYHGEGLYEDVHTVFDGGIITAKDMAPIKYAHMIFSHLGLDENEEIFNLYEKFKLMDRVG